MKTSTLELRWRTRLGESGRTERKYLDFLIDGVSLQEQVRPGDQISSLGWRPAKLEQEYIQQLLVRTPTESPTKRVPIYVCGECGDLDCGAITVVVERTPSGFVWRDFAFENGDDTGTSDTESYRGIGPFLFNKTEYWQVLNERAAELSAA